MPDVELLLNKNKGSKIGKAIFRYIALYMVLTLFSCHDAEYEATHSLKGDWTVNEVVITFGSSPFSQDSVWRFEGDIGNFWFEKEVLSYDYLDNQLKQRGEGAYVLSTFEENTGFTRIRKWRLELSDHEYEIEFNDGTKRSYKNANQITMINHQIHIAQNIHSTIILKLAKK